MESESQLLPITALALLQCGRLYCLSGEGPHLRIFDHKERRILYEQQVLEAQTIHGIACQTTADEHSRHLLIWGGRSACVLEARIQPSISLESSKARVGPDISVIPLISEGLVADWILNGCFKESTKFDLGNDNLDIGPLIVTAHNEVYVLDCGLGYHPVENVSMKASAHRIATGPRSILYSGHVQWPLDGPVLVAAGTVLGEVILWSFDMKDPSNPNVQVRHVFQGHEGSVFGVRISDKLEGMSPERLLASCSDDRSIRIWDISDAVTVAPDQILDASDQKTTSAKQPGMSYSSEPLAVAIGHASRIWGLRLLQSKRRIWHVISHGEDSTAQIWRLRSNLEEVPSKIEISTDWSLFHDMAYAFHSGKNIWAIAEHQTLSEESVMATGGADGKLITYSLLIDNNKTNESQLALQCTVDEALVSAGSTVKATKRNESYTTATKSLFDALKGEWKLAREVQSMKKTLPSGIFKGTAIFEMRPATNIKYSTEYLFSETGEFVTAQGLAMKAARQYVYRYNEATDTISVWFVKVEDGSTVDYFFHDLNFSDAGNEASKSHNDNELTSLRARGYHLCIKDEYQPEYTFNLYALGLRDWRLKYNVQGPDKDYTTNATYTRNDQVWASQVVGKPLPNSVGIPQSNLAKPDAFKAYTWIDDNVMMTITEQGNVLIGTINSMRKSDSSARLLWRKIDNKAELASSCMMTAIPALGLAFMAGNDGSVFSYTHDNERVSFLHKLPGKTGFLSSHNLTGAKLDGHVDHGTIAVMAKCLYSFQVMLLLFEHSKEALVPYLKHIQALHLPPAFIVTSSAMTALRGFIMLGSRGGNVVIYENSLEGRALEPRAIFAGLHESETVTEIKVIGRSEDAFDILTAGRDGKYGIHRTFYGNINISNSVPTLQTLHIGVPPFGPNIEGACITNGNLFLWGFRSVQFIVWNETQTTEVMTVDCGGAHRNWVYKPCDGTRGGGSLVWTKSSVCNIATQSESSHQALQQGCHGREIKALAMLPTVHEYDGGVKRLYATGAEDTKIRIFERKNSAEGWKCLNVITKHTTGLQKLRWSSNGKLLFSAASCEEFYIWRIQSVPIVDIGNVCVGECPKVTEESDLRIMDLAVQEIHTEESDSSKQSHNDDDSDYLISMIYSDSSIRIFRYHPDFKNDPFTLLLSGTYTTHCLTQCLYIRLEDTLYMCTSSTNGHIAFWPLTNALLTHGISDTGAHLICDSNAQKQTQPPERTIKFTKRIAIHQNSIKSMIAMSYTHNSQRKHLIMTAGDDGAIAFIMVSSSSPLSSLTTQSTVLIPKAHASAVTAIAHIPSSSLASSMIPHRQENEILYHVASVGNDQRLKQWSVSIDVIGEGAAGIHVVKEGDVATAVADASALEVYEESDGKRCLLVVGIGMESWIWRVGGGGLSKV